MFHFSKIKDDRISFIFLLSDRFRLLATRSRALEACSQSNDVFILNVLQESSKKSVVSQAKSVISMSNLLQRTDIYFSLVS